MDIRKNALLVRLSIHSWGDERRSRESEKAAADQYKANSNRIKSHKKLIDSPILDAIYKLQRQMREEHYYQTLPWGDDNRRLITNTGYMNYLDTIRKRSGEITALVDQLVQDWDSLVAASAKEEEGLGQLWNKDNYPTAEEVKESFGHTVSFDPVPEGGDIRVEGLGDEELAKIKKTLEEGVEAKAAEAVKDVWDRIAKALHLLKSKAQAVQTNPKGTRVHQSTIDNLVGLGHAIPFLNLGKDPVLDSVGAAIIHKFGSLQADTMKDYANAVAVEAGAEVLLEQAQRYSKDSLLLYPPQVTESSPEPIVKELETVEKKEDPKPSNDFMRNFKVG